MPTVLSLRQMISPVPVQTRILSPLLPLGRRFQERRVDWMKCLPQVQVQGQTVMFVASRFQFLHLAFHHQTRKGILSLLLQRTTINDLSVLLKLNLDNRILIPTKFLGEKNRSEIFYVKNCLYSYVKDARLS